jgi:ubiquinone/menaquinone biosynthesis C-methylase UbiE
VPGTTDEYRAAWEDWGRVDPFWAVLTAADARHGRWDVDRFFETGLEAAGWALAHSEAFGRPERHGVALDFGCGLGRLTRALAPHFERTYGLDIAFTMIERARRLDAERGPSGADFVVHNGTDLSEYGSGSVDFILSLLVLQHLPSREAIVGYLREFVRVLSPGGIAVVHLPSAVPAISQGPRMRRQQARDWLRTVGVSPRFLYERLGWEPNMTMAAIRYEETVAVLESAGATVLDAPENTVGDGVINRVYFFTPGG